MLVFAWFWFKEAADGMGLPIPGDHGAVTKSTGLMGKVRNLDTSK